MEDTIKDLAVVVAELVGAEPDEARLISGLASRFASVAFTLEFLSIFLAGAAAVWLSARLLVMTALVAGAYLAGVEQGLITPIALAPALFVVGLVVGVVQALLSLILGPQASTQALMLLGIGAVLALFLNPLRNLVGRLFGWPHL